MSTVQQDFKRRLARAEITASAVHPADLQAASHRQLLRTRVHLCEFIRERFLLMGLDPALRCPRQELRIIAPERVS